MADNTATARIRADALKALKETGLQIADQVGIEPPNLSFFYKDDAYQQAQELTVLAAFNRRLLIALQAQQTQSEGGDHGDESGAAKTAKRQSHRAAVSER